MENKISRRNPSFLRYLTQNKSLIILLVLIAALAISTPTFLKTRNIINVLRQICVTGIVAMPFTFVIATGAVDLSAGSVCGMCGIVIAMLMRDGMALIPALLIGMVVGMFFGALNAIIMNELNLPPFIVTMAMQQIVRGIIYLVTNMVPINNLPASLINMGQGSWLGIPIPIYILAVFTLVFWVLAKRTSFGRYVVAMGGNPQAAYFSGINIKLIRLVVFILCGAACAVSAAVLTGRTASGQVGAGIGLETDCITAIVIGGSSFNGGLISISGTFIGCLIVGIINNGMNLLHIDTNFQVVAKGLMILIALAFDTISKTISARKKKKA